MRKLRFDDALYSDHECDIEVRERPLGVNMRLANEKDLAGMELRYPDGRAWPGNGGFDYVQEARIIGGRVASG